jgi:molybdopterin synthase sulfur carrier subunit
MTGQQAEVAVDASTVGEALGGLQSQFPALKERLRDDTGKIRRFINLYVNDEDIRFLQNEETPIKDGDEISIVPAIAGG